MLMVQGVPPLCCVKQ